MTTERLPSMVTGARLCLAPVAAYLVWAGALEYGALLFLFLLFTDLLDGHLARRLASSSTFGAYFDAATDFVLVLSLFIAFDAHGFVPVWIVTVVVACFGQFVVTSLLWGEVYDPIGKHYGTMLYGAIAARFLASGPLFSETATAVIVAYTIASVFSRIVHLRPIIAATPIEGPTFRKARGATARVLRRFWNHQI